MEVVRPGFQAIKPPSHLAKSSQKLFQRITTDWTLEPHEVTLLTLALEALDRVNQARRILKREGLTFKGSYGQPLPRPEVKMEQNSRESFAKLMRQLGLVDEEEKREPGRPPRSVKEMN